MIIIEETVGDAVQRAGQKLGFDLFYSYGHIREIGEMLASFGKSEEYAKIRYPRVMLLCDFKETVPHNGSFAETAALQLLAVA
jgi:hypothetical protein